MTTTTAAASGTSVYDIISKQAQNGGSGAKAIVEPGGSPSFAPCDPNPPIGVRPRRPHPELTVPLVPGAVIAAFTDGLFERRHLRMDDQLERLRAAVTAEQPDLVCSKVMMDMIATHRVEDDTALLVLRRSE